MVSTLLPGGVTGLTLKSSVESSGTPLVLKSDNGSHFTCNVVQDLLATHHVACLFSPPHWPQFNGGIEAGIHALKDRTAARAARIRNTAASRPER